MKMRFRVRIENIKGLGKVIVVRLGNQEGVIKSLKETNMKMINNLLLFLKTQFSLQVQTLTEAIGKKSNSLEVCQ